MKRVIAVLDLPPRRSLPNVRASFHAAATRWNAEVLWITKPLHTCHPFWQKMFVCDHVQSIYGTSHVLQLDNDMVIRSDCWVSNPVMQSYIYHFVARAKERLPEVRWQRTDPSELPYPWDKRSRAIVDGWGNRPPDSFMLQNITHIETAASLLAAYPNLQLMVSGSQDSQMKSCDAIPNHDRCGQFAATHTSYLNLLRLMLRLGPNATRIAAI